MPSLQDVVDIASTSEVSSIPSTIARILEVISNKDAGAMELKSAIELDPPLATRVLRVANSPYYGIRQPISDVLQAIVFIGFESVKELALSQKVCQLFTDKAGDNRYSSTSLWRHSIAVALCGKSIYRKIFSLQGHDIYCIGLIHDIGIIITEQTMPKTFTSIIDVMHAESKNLIDVEMAMLGFSHVDIGKELAIRWHFPHHIGMTIGMDEQTSLTIDDSKKTLNDDDDAHCNIDNISYDELLRLINTLFIANYNCRMKNIGFKECYKENQQQYHQCLKLLEVSQQEIDIIMNDVSKEIHAMSEQGLF